MASLPVKAVKPPANTGRVFPSFLDVYARVADAGDGGARRARSGAHGTQRGRERPESSARSAYRVESWVEEVRIFTFHHAFVTYRGHPMQSAVSTRMHTWARRAAAGGVLLAHNRATTQRLALGLRPSWRSQHSG